MNLTVADASRSYRQRRAEKMAALQEALDWAICEIEGRTRYTKDYQFGNCLAKAREALGNYKPPLPALNPGKEMGE